VSILKTIYGALIVAGLFLSVFVIGTAYNVYTNSPVSSVGWVHHTQLVYRELQEVARNIAEAEANKRGYIITGRTNYLDSFNNSRPRIATSTQRIASLTSDNTNQQRRLSSLHDLLDEKYGEMLAAIDARQNRGFDSAAAIVATNTSKRSLDRINAIVVEMMDEEDRLLEIRNAKARADILHLTVAVIFIILRDVAMFNVYHAITHAKIAPTE
jgi:methyl-accepting chemotaxis protein